MSASASRPASSINWKTVAVSTLSAIGSTLLLGGVTIVGEEVSNSRQHERELTLIEKQQKAELRKEMRTSHGEYSQCMAKAFSFARESNNDFDLAAQRFLADFTSASPSPKAIELNTCRSTCRRYWSTARTLVDLGIPQTEVDDLAGRHARFVKVMRPMDKLDGYTEKDYRVYDRL
jgi:hypothetical protein